MSTRSQDDPLAVRVADLARRVTARGVTGVEPIPAGLGTRRFLRICLAGDGPPSLVARVEGLTPARTGAPGPEPPLEPIRGLLEGAGLPVPRCYGSDPTGDILLLEDVGDTSLERAVGRADPATRRRLYRQAVELVPRLQSVSPDHASTVAAFERRLDAALIATKARKWLEWTLPHALGRAPSSSEERATHEAFAVVIEACRAAPARLAHRDFKAANLHLVSDETSTADRRLVMIDLQGAFLAPPEYDLMCLLRDSHVRLPEDEVQDHLESIRSTLPDSPDRESFERRFDLLTLVRVAKDVSHYVDAATTRGDRRYLPFVANGLHNLRAAAARAATRDGAVGPFDELLARVPIDFADGLASAGPGGPTCAP